MSVEGDTAQAKKPNVRELRRSRRKKTLLPATLVTDAGSSDCYVLDLSSGGARVESPIAVAEEQAVTLIVKPLGTFAGLVAWRGNRGFGVKFLAQHGAMGANPTALQAALQSSVASPRMPLIDTAAAGHPRKIPTTQEIDAAAPEADAAPRTAGRVRKPRPPAPERSIVLRRGDVICVLRKKSGGVDAKAKSPANCRRRETLRVGNLANCKLVEIDAKNFMALLEQRSAFSITLMRVASCGGRRQDQHSAGIPPSRAPRHRRGSTERVAAAVA